MWWEALPPMLIIGGALTLAYEASRGINLLIFGVPYKRVLHSGFERRMLVRDERVSGSPFVPLGLDSLSDEPGKVK